MVFALASISLGVDFGQVATRFLEAAGIDYRTLKQTVDAPDWNGQTTVRFQSTLAGRQFETYSVDFDKQGKPLMASNGGLTHRRSQKNPAGARTALSENECRKRLGIWVKKWPGPKGSVERSFVYRGEGGDTWVHTDRKVGGYWLGATMTYAIDTRTGVMSRFLARNVEPGNTALTIKKQDAIKTAEAHLGPAITKYGPHVLHSVNIRYQFRPGSQTVVDLAYVVSFRPKKQASFYTGAYVDVHGATGKVMGAVHLTEIKSRGKL